MRKIKFALYTPTAEQAKPDGGNMRPHYVNVFSISDAGIASYSDTAKDQGLTAKVSKKNGEPGTIKIEYETEN